MPPFDSHDPLGDDPLGIPSITPAHKLPAGPGSSFSPQPQVVQVEEPGFGFLDAAATRKAIYERTLDQVKNLKPLANQKYTLALRDVNYVDPDHFSLKEQKKAILEGRTLTRRLRGTWDLLDNATGKPLHSKTTTLAAVPHYTDRGTFILNGSDYTLASQLRLKPGVFTRRKENGELESHFNVMPGQGMSHRIHLDPESGVFKMQVGQSQLSLVPILRAMGVTDTQLKEHWGELYGPNAQAADSTAVSKLHQRLIRGADKALDEPTKLTQLKAALEKMPLDEDVTEATLGKRYKNITADAYIDATKKLLGLSRGEAEPDDRDHLAFMTVHGPEDLISERISKDQSALRKALWKATMKGDLSGMGTGLFTRSLQAAIMGSGLGQPSEEVNPTQVMEQMGRISRMGVGGIPSIDAVPNESRSVQPSHLGFIDPISTPENMRAGVDSRVSNTAIRGKDNHLYATFLDKEGKKQLLSAKQLMGKTIAFPGALRSNEPFVPAMANGRIKFVPRDQVDLHLPAMEDAFGPISNLVPMKSGVKGQRLAMGSRMTTQALPLIGAEAPHVQSGVPGDADESYEERYGSHLGSIKATHGGYVKDVTDDSIEVELPDGTIQSHELAVHVPNNRKTGFHQTPLVKAGQRIEPGQLLATSNYTDQQGRVALGKNIRIAMVPGFGNHSNYEDAWVISESAAEKFKSEHYYQHEVGDEEGISLSKKAFISAFPTKYQKKVLDNFDEEGVIKPGTVVQPHDPLILAVKQKEANRSQVYRGHGPSYVDKAEVWDHHTPGIVTDVVRTKDGAKVVVRTEMPAEVGDKLSNRFGGKGLIGSIVEDHQMPRDEDNEVVDLLFNPAGVISRCYDEETEFLTETGWKLGKDVRDDEKLVCYHPWTENLYLMNQLEPMYRSEYTGEMIAVQNKLVDFCVTPDHRMWVRPATASSEWRETRARKIFGGNWAVPVAGNPIKAGCSDPIVLPAVDMHGRPGKPLELDRGDFAEFMGWYLSEGNTTYQESTDAKRCEYKVHISQSRAVNPREHAMIEELLEKLPFGWHYSDKNIQFHIGSKQLAHYLKQFGLCHEKFIPAWVFESTVEIRQRFLDAFWFGDGAEGENGKGSKISSAGSRSNQLIDDLQRLYVYQGISAGKTLIKTKDLTRPMWRCARHYRRTRILEDKNWRRISYSGMIYCPTVPTGYVVTRRNGKLLFAGNTNPAAAIEFALGKIAAKTGKPYKIKDFDKIEDLAGFAMDEMKKHNVSDLGHIIDPATGRKIKDVLTGSAYFMKLHHTSASKIQGRGTGGYTAEGQPSKGVGTSSAKRLALMSLNALLSHGATDVIRDGLLVRGQANPQYWLQFMSGHTPPNPEVPFVHQKFVNELKAAGVNVVREGTKFRVKALRHQDIDDLAADRIIRNAETVNWKDGLKPVKGGLFDESISGGHGGKRWSAIKLAEPMPSPIFEEPIRRILGLTEKKYRDVLAGKEQFRGMTGPEAVTKSLAGLNLDREIERARQDIDAGKKTLRDAAIRRLGYLKSAKKDGIHPSDWVWHKVPVLPPVFRPVSVMSGNKRPMVADPNILYKELFDASQNLGSMKGQVEDVGPERLAVYDAIKAVAGLDDPIHPKTVERGVKGILQNVLGSSPKFGSVQRKLLSAPVDLVGRAVIVPNPDLDIDSVGIPEEHAWSVYKPFIVRRLVRRGMQHSAAAQAVADKDPKARAALGEEMGARPVILDRAPVLHRYGVMAFWPRLIKGDTIHLSPLVTAGYGADFDGDQMNYQVPAGDDAVKEAVAKMLPSKNLLAASNFQVHQIPTREFAAGLWMASKPPDKDKHPITFASTKDAVAAYRRGEIDVDTPIEIAQHA
jgi:DNA-directed RNA polymerase beta subunit